MATNNKNKMGKGLAAIFGVENILDEINNETIEGKIFSIEIDQIEPNPYQPRKNFEDSKLQELANSIKSYGIITPLIVKKMQKINKYYLIAGERRLKAAKIINLKVVPVKIVEYSDDLMQEVALLENLQREDLTPIEEALAYKVIMEKSKISQEQLATKISKSRSYVANIVRLLNLPPIVIDFLNTNKLTYGHLKPLLKLNQNQIISISQEAIEKKMTVREVEEIAQKLKNKKMVNFNDNYFAYQTLFTNKINSRVILSNKKIMIPFENDEHLKRIFEKLDIKFND